MLLKFSSSKFLFWNSAEGKLARGPGWQISSSLSQLPSSLFKISWSLSQIPSSFLRSHEAVHRSHPAFLRSHEAFTGPIQPFTETILLIPFSLKSLSSQPAFRRFHPAFHRSYPAQPTKPSVPSSHSAFHRSHTAFHRFHSAFIRKFISSLSQIHQVSVNSSHFTPIQAFIKAILPPFTILIHPFTDPIQPSVPPDGLPPGLPQPYCPRDG